jgi:lysophospholipase L1-like esterase
VASDDTRRALGVAARAEASDAGVATTFLHQPEALGRFFARLHALEREGQGRVAIMQLGASHTAAHVFTDEGRRILSQRFGSAGRGFIAAGKASPRLERAGVSRALVGPWVVEDALTQRRSGVTWGLTGVRAVGAAGASVSVSFDEPLGKADDTARMQLYYLEQPTQPTPEVLVDGERLALEVPPPQRTAVRVIEFAAPGARHVVSVRNPGPGPLAVFGVSHELMKPGIVYDALGLPGSTASTLASYDQEALGEQVRARQPDLFVFFYGTNESGLSAPRVDEMRRSYPLLFATLRKAAPDADCLILAPTDRMSRKRGEPWREAESLAEVTAAMQQVALEQGCAFWHTGAAMGGKGAIERWRREKLALPDRVHLTTEGYQRLSGLAIGALLRAYDEWSGRP